MIKYGIYYHDQLDHVIQLFTSTSIVDIMKEFNYQIKTRDAYDEAVELCFVDENNIYLSEIYYEEYPKDE